MILPLSNKTSNGRTQNMRMNLELGPDQETPLHVGCAYHPKRIRISCQEWVSIEIPGCNIPFMWDLFTGKSYHKKNPVLKTGHYTTWFLKTSLPYSWLCESWMQTYRQKIDSTVELAIPSTLLSHRNGQQSEHSFTSQSRFPLSSSDFYQLTSFVKKGFKWLEIFDKNTHMAVFSTLLRAACCRVRIWKLHQVNHLRTHIQPGSPIW